MVLIFIKYSDNKVHINIDIFKQSYIFSYRMVGVDT